MMAFWFKMSQTRTPTDMGLEAACRAYAREYALLLPGPPTSVLSMEFLSSQRLDPEVLSAFLQGYYSRDGTTLAKIAERVPGVANLVGLVSSPETAKGKIKNAYMKGVKTRG